MEDENVHMAASFSMMSPLPAICIASSTVAVAAAATVAVATAVATTVTTAAAATAATAASTVMFACGYLRRCLYCFCSFRCLHH
eukprot:9089998-Ditylum_brightwellii.AAC.1